MARWRTLSVLVVFVITLFLIPSPTFAAASSVPMTVTLSNGAVGATHVTNTYTVTWNSTNGCQWAVNAVTIDAPPGQSFASVTELTWINGGGTSNGTFSPTAVSAASVSFSLGSGACEGGNYTNQFVISGVTNTATPASGTSTLNTFDGTTPETTSTVTIGTYNGLSLSVSPATQDPGYGAVTASAQLLAGGTATGSPGMTVTFTADSAATPPPALIVNGASGTTGTVTTTPSGGATAPITDPDAPDTVTVTASVPAASGTYTATQSFTIAAPRGTVQGTTPPPAVVVPANAGTVTVPVGSLTWTDNFAAGELYALADPATVVIAGATDTLPWSEAATLSSTCSTFPVSASSASVTTEPALGFYTESSGPASSDPAFVTPAGGCTVHVTATVSVDWNVVAGTYPLTLASPTLAWIAPAT